MRLGGMALANGVLVHGPRHWACAVRTEDGELKVASGLKPVRAVDVKRRLARGPARIAEVFAPPAPGAPQSARGSASLSAPGRARRHGREHGGHPGRPADKPLAADPGVASRTARARPGGDGAPRHGPRRVPRRGAHLRSGRYEHGEPRTREHERCGSHMIGPLLVTTALGGSLLARAASTLRPAARLAAASARSPRVGRALLLDGAKRAPSAGPGARTARPRAPAPLRHRRAAPEQLEVAEAALAGMPPPRIPCKWRTRRRGSASRLRSSTSRSRRCGRATTPTPTSTTRARRCSRTGATRASSCRSSRRSRPCWAAWTRRSRSSSSAPTTGRS